MRVQVRAQIMAAGVATLLISGSAPSTAAAQKPTTACGLLSVAELRRAAGRNDLATLPERSDEEGKMSNCERSGAIDVTLVLMPSSKTQFARMRDTYAKSPASVGFKVESVSGVGEEAYYVARRGRVQVRTLVGGRELTVEMQKISAATPGEMPPDPEAKAIAVRIAKAAAARMQ